MELKVKNKNVKIIASKMCKNKEISLVAINDGNCTSYLILIDSLKEHGDGYIYDDLDAAKKDFNSLLNNECGNVFSRED